MYCFYKNTVFPSNAFNMDVLKYPKFFYKHFYNFMYKHLT